MVELQIVKKIFKSEYLLMLRNKGDFFNILVFFILISTIWALSIPGGIININKIGPSIIWVSLLLVIYLNMEKMFRLDYRDGTLSQWKLKLNSLTLYAFSKIVVHWSLSVIPLILITPCLALMFHLSINTLIILIMALLLGAWCLIALGAMAVTLTIKVESSSILVAILLLPLYVPILLLGIETTLTTTSSDLLGAYFCLLIALAIILGLISPVITACGLKIALSE